MSVGGSTSTGARAGGARAPPRTSPLPPLPPPRSHRPAAAGGALLLAACGRTGVWDIVTGIRGRRRRHRVHRRPHAAGLRGATPDHAGKRRLQGVAVEEAWHRCGNPGGGGGGRRRRRRRRAVARRAAQGPATAATLPNLPPQTIQEGPPRQPGSTPQALATTPTAAPSAAPPSHALTPFYDSLGIAHTRAVAEANFAQTVVLATASTCATAGTLGWRHDGRQPPRLTAGLPAPTRPGITRSWCLTKI